MKIRLSTRIALLMGVLVLVVSGASGLLGIIQSSNTTKSHTNETLGNAARDGVKIIEATISKDLAVLQELANRRSTQSMEWETQKEYLELDITRLGFLEIGVVGLDGIAHYISNDSTADLAERDYIKKALQGEANISNVLISKVTNQAVVMLAAPIKDNNKIVGALIARKDGTFLNEITSNLGFGENGYAIILGSDGTIYAHENSDFIMEQKNIFVDADSKKLGDAINKLGMGNAGVIDYEFSGNKRIMGIETMENTDWIIGVGAYESDVFAELTKLKIILLIGIIIFTILGQVVGFYFARYISNPIVEYSNIIGKLADYDLSLDDNSKTAKYLKRSDEIGNIGNALIIMQKNLIDLVGEISNVAQQVASSSQELTATSEQSAVASEEVARAIEDIAQGATDQAKETERGAMTIGNLGKQIQANIQGVTNLNSAAKKIQVLKDEGLEIMESLRGHTSGYCVPTFVVDAPGGGGKIPVMPNYVLAQSHDKVVLRNYEGVITTYTEPPAYEESCSCDVCTGKKEHKLHGVAGLLQGNKIAIEPEHLERHERSKKA